MSRDTTLWLNLAGLVASAGAVAVMLSAGGPDGSGWTQLADVSLRDRRAQVAIAVLLSPVVVAALPLVVPWRGARRVTRLVGAVLLWALGPVTVTPFFMPAAGALLLAGLLTSRKPVT